MALKSLWRPWLLVAFVSGIICCISAEALSKPASELSAQEIEDALQHCPLVQNLNHHIRSTSPQTLSYTAQIFEKLFPYGPAVNALLATLYISGPPNFLLALCPPNIDPSSLSVMVAFAVGGLLGDTLFHLLPEIFLGEAATDHARFVMVEPNKNLLLGVAIMVGFLTFVAMDKSLRIATGGDGHDPGHTHKVEGYKSKEKDISNAVTSGAKPMDINGQITARKEASQPRSVTIYEDMNELKLPPAVRKNLWYMEEPKRANSWLKRVLEEDPDSGMTQITIWKAYEAAFGPSTTPPPTPLVEATALIQSASKVFDGARAELVEEPAKKFIIQGVRPRRPLKKEEPKPVEAKAQAVDVSGKEPSQSIRLSAYLNLIADFTHNITDGLALSSSFYASPTLGATTTVAVFFHEIPHEVGDFALLIQSGFSKRQAMGAQFVTALGAFLGTCLGIAVQELGKSEIKSTPGELPNKGLAGTGLGWGDMLLPFTAGTFLYVGTVAVIPELLETGAKKGEEVRKTLTQFLAMFVGAGIMLAISWS